ncbi:MAG: FkbM family methyltransferase [Thermoplasmata archaeon]
MTIINNKKNINTEGMRSKVFKVKIIRKYFQISYFKIVYSYFKKVPVNAKLSNGEIIKNVRLNVLSDLSLLLEKGWAIENIGEKGIITINNHEVSIICRINKGFDIGHLVEIFIKEVYKDNFKERNVIDIGMSNGDSSIYFAMNGAKKVIGVEPFPESFNLAKINVENSKMKDKIILINKALSFENGKTELITLKNYPNANSIDESNMVTINDSRESILVDEITLDDIIQMFDGEDIYLLKMDCEGCEYKVLHSVNKTLLKRVKKIILEFHNGVQSIDKLLYEAGFKVDIKGELTKMGYLIAERKE